MADKNPAKRGVRHIVANSAAARMLSGLLLPYVAVLLAALPPERLLPQVGSVQILQRR